LRNRRSGLRDNDFTGTPLVCAIGRVDAIETQALPPDFDRYDCRNNRLAWAGLQADGFLDTARSAIARHGADRVATDRNRTLTRWFGKATALDVGHCLRTEHARRKDRKRE